MNQRILSVDVFRGIIIVLMILVNSQIGSSSYPILLHADWNGFTLADFVFPSFLFIVGLTSVVSFSNQEGNKRKLYVDVVKRSFILFILGLALNMIFRQTLFNDLRVFGILQRIAMCYLISSFIYLNTSLRTQAIIFVTTLVVYWYVLTQITVPGGGLNQLTPAGSWVSYVDSLFVSSTHLLKKTYDPEGFLSTFPAVATTLLGVMVGHLILSDDYKNKKKFLLMLLCSLACLLLGALWNDTFPINKNLWTSSFVLWSGGWALLLYSSCFLLIDILGYKQWSLPFKLFGMNALFAFVAHVLLIKVLIAWKITSGNGGEISLKHLIMSNYFSQYSHQDAALFFSWFFLLVNFLLVIFLYQRKIFIRV